MSKRYPRLLSLLVLACIAKVNVVCSCIQLCLRVPKLCTVVSKRYPRLLSLLVLACIAKVNVVWLVVYSCV